MLATIQSFAWFLEPVVIIAWAVAGYYIATAPSRKRK
jgi:hypothetical protein